MSASFRKRIGDYEVVAEIGSGSQGPVYKAVCASPVNDKCREGEAVALKRLIGDGREEETYFQRQSEQLAALHHPNLVGLREIVVDQSGAEESRWLVMDLLEGQGLDKFLEAYPEGLSWSRTQRVFMQALDALAAAEQAGVLHRDLKPASIFLCADNTVKLVGFASVRSPDSAEATTGGWKGALDYMAPDFVTEKNFGGDAVSDIYSLGVCFFQALSGSLPYTAFSANAGFEYFTRWSTHREASYPLGEMLLRKEFRKLKRCVQLLPGLHDFLLRAICPLRSGRFRSFAEMRQALAGIGYAKVQGAINTYELVDLLGQGGFGKVFLGRVVQTGEFVAIKQLLSAVNERRFAREADMLRKFGHPNIVKYIELIQANEGGSELRSYLVMENLPGMPQWSLRNRLKMTPGGLEPVTALQIFARYLLALHHLHCNGIIHRDIKPANLYAPEDDVANTKIFDFGIARESDSTLTQGSAPGTLDFMSPEFAMLRDFKGSPVSDIYAMGLCFYETVCGRLPFERLSQSKMPAEAAFYMRAQSKPTPDFAVPVLRRIPELEAILRKSLHYNPRLRYRTCHAMLQDIVALLEKLTGEPCRLLDGVEPPANPPEPEPIPEFEAAAASEGEGEHFEESLDTLASAPAAPVAAGPGTVRTARIATPARPAPEPEAAEEPDTQQTVQGGQAPAAKGRPPVSGRTPPPAATAPTSSRPTRPEPDTPARVAPPPSLPTRRSKGPWMAILLVLLLAGAAGGFILMKKNASAEADRLAALLARVQPAEAAEDPLEFPAVEAQQALAETRAWLERNPSQTVLAEQADTLSARAKGWPREVDRAFDKAVKAGDAPRAKALAAALEAVGADAALEFFGMSDRAYQRQVKAMQEELAGLAAAPPVKPPVTPPTPPLDPTLTQTDPKPAMPPVTPPMPTPEEKLEAGVALLRQATEPALAALAAADSVEAVMAAFSPIAASWIAASGEVKTRALGTDWWKARADAVATAVRRVSVDDSLADRAPRLAAQRTLVDHELLAEWLPPDLHAALRDEQKQREAVCLVEVANASGGAAVVSGLGSSPLELANGEKRMLRIPGAADEVSVVVKPKSPGMKEQTLRLRPVPGTGQSLSIPPFAPMAGGIRLALRQPAAGPAVQAVIKDPEGREVDPSRLGSLPDGEYTVLYQRADYRPMSQKVPVAAGKNFDLPGPAEADWQPGTALAALRAVPEAVDGLPAEKLAEFAKVLEGLALADPAHQALLQSRKAAVDARLRKLSAAMAEKGHAVIDAWRDYFHQVGVFSGLSVILRSEDRRTDTRPAAIPAGVAGPDPASQRLELWRQASVSKASRVEREGLAARFEELARLAESNGDAALALACRVDAEVMRSRRRRPPAKDLVEKSAYLRKVRAHTMYAGPEGLSGGVGPQETMKDLLDYASAGGVISRHDALLACYATYFAWSPSLSEPEENRRKFANDPDYQRNIADMRRNNAAIARQLAEILGKTEDATAQAVAEALRADTEAGSWLLASMTRILPSQHPLYAAGRKWLTDNPVDRIDKNATLDHVGLEPKF